MCLKVASQNFRNSQVESAWVFSQFECRQFLTRGATMPLPPRQVESQWNHTLYIIYIDFTDQKHLSII